MVKTSNLFIFWNFKQKSCLLATKARCTCSILSCLIYWSIQLMMPIRLSHRAYTNNILRDAKSKHNTLKGYMYTENKTHKYLNLLSVYQFISKSFEIYWCNDNILRFVSFIEHCSQSVEHLHGQYIARVS